MSRSATEQSLSVDVSQPISMLLEVEIPGLNERPAHCLEMIDQVELEEQSGPNGQSH